MDKDHSLIYLHIICFSIISSSVYSMETMELVPLELGISAPDLEEPLVAQPAPPPLIKPLTKFTFGCAILPATAFFLTDFIHIFTNPESECNGKPPATRFYQSAVGIATCGSLSFILVRQSMKELFRPSRRQSE